MNSLAAEAQEARAQSVVVSEDSLSIDLVDGRTVVVPIVWYPRLWHATTEERARFEIFGEGAYVHWSDLDEDLTVAGFLLGRRSGESSRSLKKWLQARKDKGE